LAREWILTHVLGEFGAKVNSVLSEYEEYEFSWKQSTPANAFSASLAMATSDNTATAIIGNEGWVTVGGSATVHALAEDPFQLSMSAHAGDVLPASEKNFGAALAFSKTINQANAFIAWNADVDVKNTLDITSTAHIISPVDPLDFILAILGLGQATQLGAIGSIYGLLAGATTDNVGDNDSIGKSAIDPPTAAIVNQVLDEDEIGTTFVHAAGPVARQRLVARSISCSATTRHMRELHQAHM
jgi:hypothetical protein